MSAAPYEDDLPPKYTATAEPPQAGGASSSGGPGHPASESTPLLPQVEVPAQPRLRYRSREELRWCTCCYLCGLCIVYFVVLLGSFVGLLILFGETVLALFLWLFYIPGGLVVWCVVCNAVVYRARMQELREFGPEEGIVTVRVFILEFWGHQQLPTKKMWGT
ncbi:hypothetical protein EV426DRAFT_571003 [Tirmania nivea]|nr:hypothetical protein EV426DRAFT_571003 [Tirmania nivea]